MKTNKTVVMKKTRLLLLILLTGSFASGCGTMGERDREKREQGDKAKKEAALLLENTFNAKDYESFSKTGTGSMSGQAFATTRGGQVRYAAGKKVFLMPDTRHSRAYVEAIAEPLNTHRAIARYRSFAHTGFVWAGFSVEGLPQLHFDAKSFTRTTTADAEGKFTFEELPEGSYIAVTLISWGTGSGLFDVTGAYFSSVVDIKNGKKSNIILEQK